MENEKVAVTRDELSTIIWEEFEEYFSCPEVTGPGPGRLELTLIVSGVLRRVFHREGPATVQSWTCGFNGRV